MKNDWIGGRDRCHRCKGRGHVGIRRTEDGKSLIICKCIVEQLREWSPERRQDLWDDFRNRMLRIYLGVAVNPTEPTAAFTKRLDSD